LQNSDTLERLINNSFVGKTYDSVYSVNGSVGKPYNFLIYETSTGSTYEILFYKGTLSPELKPLERYINKLIESPFKTQTAKFIVNQKVIELQRKLFLKFPPPPPPEEVVEQKVKFRLDNE